MARPRLDETGKRYGKLTILGPATDGDRWLARCDCGRETDCGGYGLRIGQTRQCMPCSHEESRQRALSRRPQMYDWTVEFERIGCSPFRVVVSAHHHIKAGVLAREIAYENECGETLISIVRGDPSP